MYEVETRVCGVGVWSEVDDDGVCGSEGRKEGREGGRKGVQERK